MYREFTLSILSVELEPQDFLHKFFKLTIEPCKSVMSLQKLWWYVTSHDHVNNAFLEGVGGLHIHIFVFYLSNFFINQH